MTGEPAPAVETLAASALFADLPAEALAAVAAACERVARAKGRTLFLRGDPGETMYVVAQGRVRLSLATPDGREITVGLIGPGAAFGEMAAFDGAPRSADATAASDVVLHALRRPALDALMAAHPALARAAVSYLCRKLRATTDQLEGVALYPLERRIARFLAAALEGATPRPGARVGLELGMSQTDLSQLLGASRPKVNVALGALEKRGALKRTSDRLFCDPARLEAIAAGEA